MGLVAPGELPGSAGSAFQDFLAGKELGSREGRVEVGVGDSHGRGRRRGSRGRGP